jgi:hypothetical protein
MLYPAVGDRTSPPLTAGYHQPHQRSIGEDMEPPATTLAAYLAILDDPAFLAARARVRGQCMQAPDDIELAAEYVRMNAEFDRRARGAWQAGAA